jgi:hypothetical protein
MSRRLAAPQATRTAARRTALASSREAAAPPNGRGTAGCSAEASR